MSAHNGSRREAHLLRKPELLRVCRTLRSLQSSTAVSPHLPPPETNAPVSSAAATPLLFKIDLLLMPKCHTERLTKGSVCTRPPDKHLRHLNRKFGLHQPWGGTCHPEPSGLMGLIYVLLSSFFGRGTPVPTFVCCFCLCFDHRNDKVCNLRSNLNTVAISFFPFCRNVACQG